MTTPKKVLLLFRPGSSVAATFKEILEFENFYTITIMDNPILALMQIKDNLKLYDVIFLEVWLEKMDGITTMEWLLALQITTPILITSFHMKNEDGKKLEQKGAFKYIICPPDIHDLLDTFQQAVDYNQKLISTHTGK